MSERLSEYTYKTGGGWGTMRQATAYGGTVSNCAFVAVYPSALTILGKNRLKAYKEPSTPIYITIPVYVFQSL
jgi:hypothetical protein